MPDNNILEFTKMQGAGNDFVVIDNRKMSWSLEKLIELTPLLCNRRYGIGADGLMALFPSDEYDYTMIYRNADGSDAGMCGNGARCLAAFAQSLGFPQQLTFNVHSAVYRADIHPDSVSVHFPGMVTPKPLGNIEGLNLYETYTNTEHVVSFHDEAFLEDEKKLVQIGSAVRYNHFFPAGTNVNFVSGSTADEIKLQTYERGVEDLTLACGTGALASAITWVWKSGNIPEQGLVKVHCKGGILQVSFEYDSEKQEFYNLILKGSAEIVYTGVWTNL